MARMTSMTLRNRTMRWRSHWHLLPPLWSLFFLIRKSQLSGQRVGGRQKRRKEFGISSPITQTCAGPAGWGA